MSIRPISFRPHRWLAAIAVLAFALRALIPAGFMPGGSGPLTLQICPDGFPPALLDSSGGEHSAHAGHHHHHPGADMSAAMDSDAATDSPHPPTHDHRSWTAGHCVFSAVASAPPISCLPAVALVAETAPAAVHGETAALSLDLRFRIAQPRAPPSLV
jgi:hypothetical protein